MKWRCRFCGFIIKNREDRRKVKVKENKIYVLGFCDNCLNWTILDTIPIEEMKKHIHSMLDY